MIFVHRARVKAALPQVAVAPVFWLGVGRVAEVRGTNHIGEGIFSGRYSDDMDVVGHQAIAEDTHAVAGRFFSQEREVLDIVVILEEHLLFFVSPLCDVVRNSGDYYAGSPWHKWDYAQ